MVKTINPDASQQLVVFGIPNELNTPDYYKPTPWERYHYSPNDLAEITNLGVVPITSYWTPKSELIDPLGNVIRTTEHQAHYNADTDSYEDVVMQYRFDIKGQLVKSIDPYGRTISDNKYSTAGQMLCTLHIDRGEQTLLVDALNMPFVTNDAKEARSLFAYDNLQRPLFVWARDNGNEQFTKRQIMLYGDRAGISKPEEYNLNGKLYMHNDEAGKLTYESYDFKGNILAFFRQIITDDALTPYQKYVVNWDDFIPDHLSETKNTINQEYDALNRIRKAVYPEDRDGQRKEMMPTYNKGGALLSLKMDNAEYVKEVAYNARGQRILIAMGNKIMTRYAYDPQTFRVSRQRSELYKHDGHTYGPNAGIRQDLQYTYDLEGTIKSINDAAPANNNAQGPGDLLRVFTHDPLRRLMSATGRESSNAYKQPSWDLNVRPHDHTLTNTYLRTYVYDKLGNIQGLEHRADGHSNQDFGRDYSYLGSGNKLVGFTVNSTLYANLYDPNGNLTKEGESRYFDWGSNDKLSVFKNQAGNSTPSVYTNYFYNSQGERVKKHTRKGNKIVVTFYMDGGMFETSYTKMVGGEIDNDLYYNTIKISDDGALIATIQVGKNVDDKTPDIQYIIGDHLNNSSVVLTTAGSLINREEYYPFGETSFGSFKFKRYRYNGKEKDEESGLYEYGQRYYAPWLCRFVSVDPIAEKFADLSSYNYAGNKPVSKIDMEGLQEKGREKTPIGGQNSNNDSHTDDSGSKVEVVISDTEATGVVFAEGDTKAQELYNEYKAEVGDRLESAQNRVDNLNIKKENEGLKGREKKQLRAAEGELRTFSTIMDELTALENAEEVFRIRTGDNMTSESGGANVRFNPETMEIDVNVRAGTGDFSDMQKMAHELKHAHQYLEGRLILSTAGDGGFNSRELEKEGYNRQNLFATNQYEITNNVDEFVRDKYPKLGGTNITALLGSDNYNDIMRAVKGASENPDFMMPYVTYGWRNVYYEK